jgi:hypothetical protein
MPPRWSKLSLRPTMRTERQACFRRRLVKDDDVHRPGRLPSTSAPSARFRLASTGTRHRSHDFAVASRLPTPVRPSRGERLDPPPLGERPGAARRLLQSIQPASTTARSSEPRSTQPRARALRSRLGGGYRSCELIERRHTGHGPSPAEADLDPTSGQPLPDAFPGWTRPLRSQSSRGFRGQGPGELSLSRRPLSRLLAAEASPRPDPLEHLLSRARDDIGWRGRRRRVHTCF